MKRSKLLSTSILIVSVLLLNGAKNASAESRNPRSEQHKRAATENSTNTQQRNQEPTIPLSLCQATQSALSEALHTIRTQEETAAKHSRPEKDCWDKAGVIANWLLFFVGCCYTYFAWGQWDEISAQAGIAKEQSKISLTQLQLLTRPKLEIFGDTVLEQSTEVTAYFTVVNKGERAAYIEEQTFVLWDHIALLAYPQRSPFLINDGVSESSPKPLPQRFDSHDSRISQVTNFEFSSNEFRGYGKSIWQSYVDGDDVACFAGYVRYRDIDTNQIHETSFCRTWDRKALYFVIPPKMPPSYNHST
jgi:hypothetical protein